MTDVIFSFDKENKCEFGKWKECRRRVTARSRANGCKAMILRTNIYRKDCGFSRGQSDFSKKHEVT